MPEPKPRQPIRRFDVFAEYSKLEAMRDGRPLDEAKGHGLWLAKVVASRRFGASRPRAAPSAGRARPGTAEAGSPELPPFRMLGDELQTDERFDREIVDRMGREFYDQVFAPTVAAHFERGDRYEQIRDSVRKEWKPAG